MVEGIGMSEKGRERWKAADASSLASHPANTMPPILRMLVRLLIVAIMLLCSDDILFVVDVAGQSIRLCQVLELALIVLAVADRCLIEKPPSPLLLILFVFVLNTIYIVTTPVISKSVGYDGWFFINIMTMWAMSHFMGHAFTPEELVRWYVMSFTLMAAFGIVQLLLSHVGVSLLSTQYGADSSGRINGLCFEPSYYATYLLGGWAICLFLSLRTHDRRSSRHSVASLGQLCLVSAALVLSTSKLALMGMLLFLASLGCERALSFMGGNRLPKWQVLAISLLPLLLVAGVLSARVLLRDDVFISRYLSGSGLFGTSSHSLDNRMWRIHMTWEIMKSHLLVGTSFGGIDWAIDQLFYIGSRNGVVIGSFLEYGIATGVVGLCLASVFLFQTSMVHAASS